MIHSLHVHTKSSLRTPFPFIFRWKVKKNHTPILAALVIDIDLVDFNGMIHMCDLVDYRDTVCEETWRVWQEILQTFKKRQLRVSFFNSTPQGGGGKPMASDRSDDSLSLPSRPHATCTAALS